MNRFKSANAASIALALACTSILAHADDTEAPGQRSVIEQATTVAQQSSKQTEAFSKYVYEAAQICLSACDAFVGLTASRDAAYQQAQHVDDRIVKVVNDCKIDSGRADLANDQTSEIKKRFSDASDAATKGEEFHASSADSTGQVPALITYPDCDEKIFQKLKEMHNLADDVRHSCKEHDTSKIRADNEDLEKDYDKYYLGMNSVYQYGYQCRVKEEALQAHPLVSKEVRERLATDIARNATTNVATIGVSSCYAQAVARGIFNQTKKAQAAAASAASANQASLQSLEGGVAVHGGGASAAGEEPPPAPAHIERAPASTDHIPGPGVGAITIIRY